MAWDATLVAEGQRLLDLSATGSELTEYHIEAAIASVHATRITPRTLTGEKSFHFTTR
jgi:predicted RNA polymerase sigma factor